MTTHTRHAKAVYNTKYTTHVYSHARAHVPDIVGNKLQKGKHKEPDHNLTTWQFLNATEE